jgi:hypothetical protein
MRCPPESPGAIHRYAPKSAMPISTKCSIGSARIFRMRMTAGYFGEYQMGDVNARSCVVIGTFGSVILIWKYAAS